jgi:hypothetical protein
MLGFTTDKDFFEVDGAEAQAVQAPVTVDFNAPKA